MTLRAETRNLIGALLMAQQIAPELLNIGEREDDPVRAPSGGKRNLKCGVWGECGKYPIGTQNSIRLNSNTMTFQVKPSQKCYRSQQPNGHSDALDDLE